MGLRSLLRKREIMNKLTSLFCVFTLCLAVDVHAIEPIHEPAALIYWSIPFGGKAKGWPGLRYSLRFHYTAPGLGHRAVEQTNSMATPAVVNVSLNRTARQGVQVHGITIGEQRVFYAVDGEEEVEPTSSIDWPVALGIGVSIGFLGFILSQIL